MYFLIKIKLLSINAIVSVYKPGRNKRKYYEKENEYQIESIKRPF